MENEMAEQNDEEMIPAFTDRSDYEVPESKESPVPGWLKWTYIILPIWGVITYYYYFNGSHGWLDRGYWKQLQIAANTTFPFKDQDLPQKNNAVSSANSTNDN